MSRARTPLALAAAGALWLLAFPAEAQPEETSVETVAERIRAEALQVLDRVEGDARVVARAELPDDAPDTPALVEAVLGPLMEALRSDPRFVAVDRVSSDASPALARRRAAAQGVEALVHVHLGTRGNVLEVRITILEAAHGGLRDVFRPEPRVLARRAFTHRLDAHLRRYVGMLPRVDESRIVARTVPLPARGYVAMAAADLDGDGRTELVLALPDRVQVVRLGSSARGTYRIVGVGEAAPDDVDAAPARSRRPVGTAVALPREVVVRTSHWAAPFTVRLSDGAVSVSRADGPCPDAAYPLEDACAERVAGRDWFQAELLERPGVTTLPNAPSGFYARAARHLPVPDGSWRSVDAVVTPRGRLGARVDGERGGAVGYGAGLGMADLEDDGLPELLVSSPAAPGEPDRLSLVRVRPDAALIAVWSSEEIEGSIMVAGRGDLDDDGRDELLAIEEPASGGRGPARLWVVQ